MTDVQAFLAIANLASAAAIVYGVRREWSSLCFIGIALIAIAHT